MPTPAKPLQFDATTTDVALISGQGVLMGWSVAEAAGVGAVATLIIRDGQTTAGLRIATIELAADADDHQWLGGLGIQFLDGLLVDIVAGTVAGTLWAVPKDLAATDIGHVAYPVGPQTLGYPYGVETREGVRR